MACYHPRIRIENLNKWEKAKDGHRYHPAKIEQPHDLYQRLEELKNSISYKYEIIPCGNCIGCRLEDSRQKANRGYLERQLYDEGYFLTLTYDDKYLPKCNEVTTNAGITYTDNGEWKGTLFPKHWEDFMHDLRQKLDRKYKKDPNTWQVKIDGEYQKPKIRYLMAGEYGDQGLRPHYHAIMFGLHLPQETFYEPKIINKNTYWKNKIIDEAWGKGFAELSEATWNDIAYTARYITKKMNGEIADDYYASKGQIPEFYRASNRPGIGKPYFDKHWKEIYKNDEIIVKNMAGVVSMQPPKYFDDLYKEMDPKGFEEIRKNRKKRAKNVGLMKDQTTSLGRLAQLEIEERIHEEKARKLVREYEKKAP